MSSILCDQKIYIKQGQCPDHRLCPKNTKQYIYMCLINLSENNSATTQQITPSV